MQKFILVAAGLSLIGSGSHAQDMNTLDRHLEHQQSTRVQDHQNRMRSAQNGAPKSKSRTVPRCTEQHVPKADYERLKAQYRQMVATDGKPAADRWSQGQSAGWYQRLKRQGVCR